MVDHKVSLEEESLTVGVASLMLLFVLGGIDIVPYILESAGLPGYSLLEAMWVALPIGGEMGEYVVEAATVFSWAGILVGFVQWLYGINLATENRLHTVGKEDIPGFVILMFFWWILVRNQGVEFTGQVLVEGIIIVGLVMSIYSVAYYVARWTPDKTTKNRVIIKTMVTYLALVGVATTVAVMLLRIAQMV